MELANTRGSNVKSKAQADLVLLWLLSLSTYIKLHLTIPGLGVPYFFSFLLGAWALIRHNRLREVLIVTGLFLVFQFIQFLATASNLVPAKGDLQLFIGWTTSIFSLSGFIVLLLRLDASSVRRFSTAFLLGMLVFGVGEVYLGLRPFMDAIRSLYTSESSLYLYSDRDLSRYGAVRANVFTSEPSSAGNFFGVLWLLRLYSVKWSRTAIAHQFLLALAAILLFRSPTLVPYLVVGVLLGLAQHRRLDFRTLGVSLAFTFSIASMLVPYTLYSQRFMLGDESTTEFLSSGSFFVRQVAPVQLGIRMVEVNPFVGLGFRAYAEAREISTPELRSVYGGFYTKSHVAEMPDGQFVTNAAWEVVFTFGFVGMLVLFRLFSRLLRQLGVSNHAILAILSLALLVNHAGLALAFTWTPIVALAYCCSRRITSTEVSGELSNVPG